jgi:hypothetical protein
MRLSIACLLLLGAGVSGEIKPVADEPFLDYYVIQR